MKNETVKKILVLRFSSLGDVILTTPLLKILKRRFPKAEIDYCVKQQYAEALKFNPDINNIIEADNNIDFKGLKELKKQIKANSFDLIIDAHNSLRTFYLRLFLNAKKLVFKKYSLRKFLLVKFKINLMKDLPPISERYCNILSPLMTGKHGGLLQIYTNEASRNSLNKLIDSLSIPKDRKLICIVPSSNHFTKTYPAEYYSELINKFDANEYTFLLAGKGKDRYNIDKIRSNTGSNVYDLCDKLNVLELAELMKKCSLVISGDTGPMHIAEAVNVPLIMLAGSSVREFGFYPQNEKAVVLENNNLKCRPCSHIGRSECPLVHFKCMMEIKPTEIYNKACLLLTNS